MQPSHVQEGPDKHANRRGPMVPLHAIDQYVLGRVRQDVHHKFHDAFVLQDLKRPKRIEFGNSVWQAACMSIVNLI